jgi:hypothetical protein
MKTSHHEGLFCQRHKSAMKMYSSAALYASSHGNTTEARISLAKLVATLNRPVHPYRDILHSNRTIARLGCGQTM